MPAVLSPGVRDALVADLRALLGDRCTTNPTQVEHHSHGESWHAPAVPDVVVFPTTTEEVSAVMRVAAQHQAPVVPFGAGSSLEGHVNALSGGVCVDCSRMARVLAIHADDLDAAVEAPLVGHAGDGNFHLVMLLDPDNPAELSGAKALNARLVARALAVGGTCSGEHGVGMGKMDYLSDEHGAWLEVMKAIKRALDPDGRMNPGKMFR